MTGLDQCVDARKTDDKATCDWLKIQDLAISDEDDKVKKYDLQAQRLNVKLLVVRKVSHETNIKIRGVTFEPGQTVVCDIVSSLSFPRNTLFGADRIRSLIVCRIQRLIQVRQRKRPPTR